MNPPEDSRSFRNLGRILREQDKERFNVNRERDNSEPAESDAKESKDWEKFEERVEKIYRILLNLKGEKTSVSRDVKLVGRDGLIHQFDVYYEFSRAGVNHRVAIECRDKNRPLDKDAVMAFRGKVSDVLGLQGLMVSAKGYQSGAKKYAEDNGIIALTMDELPGVGSLLAMRLENVTCPDKESVGEPFWSIYEIDEDGRANGNLYGQHINGWRGALLFFSKKVCEEFLAVESKSVKAKCSVFGLNQINLRGFIMIADVFEADYYLALDVQPSSSVGQLSIGLVPISRKQLIEYYVLGDHNLPKEPSVAPGFKGRKPRR